MLLLVQVYISTFKVYRYADFVSPSMYLIGSGAKLDTVTDEEPPNHNERVDW